MLVLELREATVGCRVKELAELCAGEGVHATVDRIGMHECTHMRTCAHTHAHMHPNASRDTMSALESREATVGCRVRSSKKLWAGEVV